MSVVIPDQVGSPRGRHLLGEPRDDGEGRARAASPVTTVAALALVVVSAVIAVAGFGISFVRLSSGSMSPTFPSDSILLVRSVPADQVAVGNIVTVSRDGAVPITHRVVAATPAAGGVELVLRGDANDVDDPAPYRVSRVGLVLGGIPFGGSALVALQSPLGLGVATVVVALLVLWAWWPRREPGAHVRGPG